MEGIGFVELIDFYHNFYSCDQRAPKRYIRNMENPIDRFNDTYID